MEKRNIESLKNLGVEISRETSERLEEFIFLVKERQKIQNIISRASMEHIWERHVLDSVQLLVYGGQYRKWLDIGSGGGFPGIILAIFMAEKKDGFVYLFESHKRKSAFLEDVGNKMALPIKVYNERVEQCLKNWHSPVDCMTARAVTSLSKLLAYGYPLLSKTTVALFHKGKSVHQEILEARRKWCFEMELHKNLVDNSGYILSISKLQG